MVFSQQKTLLEIVNKMSIQNAQPIPQLFCLVNFYFFLLTHCKITCQSVHSYLGQKWNAFYFTLQILCDRLFSFPYSQWCHCEDLKHKVHKPKLKLFSFYLLESNKKAKTRRVCVVFLGQPPDFVVFFGSECWDPCIPAHANASSCLSTPPARWLPVLRLEFLPVFFSLFFLLCIVHL